MLDSTKKAIIAVAIDDASSGIVLVVSQDAGISVGACMLALYELCEMELVGRTDLSIVVDEMRWIKQGGTHR